jgi:hypothetical protein
MYCTIYAVDLTPVFCIFHPWYPYRMFLSLPVSDLDQDPDPSINKQVLRFLFDFLSMKTDVNIPLKSNKQKFEFFIGILCCQPRTKKAGSGSVVNGTEPQIRICSGGQNVIDPQLWYFSLS